MATHRISILRGDLLPDVTGNTFWEPATVKFTNDRWKYGVWIFNDTATRLELFGTFNVPKNYIGTALIKVVWTSTAITGNAVWDFDYRGVGGDDAESLDQLGEQEALTVTDAAPTTALFRLEASMTITSANLAVDDTVQFLIARDGVDAAETLAAAAILHDVIFQYNDA